MEIRTFRQSDTDGVVALWNDVFTPTAAHHDPQRVIQQKVAAGDEMFFVAVVGDQLVGTVMCGYDGHRGWIYTLAVRPDFRRRGIGTELMKRAERELAGLGCPKINFQVLPENSRVVEFYRCLGYSVEDRISMGKLLD